MDTLYIGDIPQNYHYARFSNYYIDLYDRQNLSGTLNGYRVYLYDNAFMYEPITTNFSQYNTYTAVPILVTDKPFYRRDIDSIVVIVFCIVIFGLWLCNLVTSFIKKGGLLGGLF